MTEHRDLKDALKAKIKEAVADGSNIASAINVGSKGQTTAVSSKQRVIHRNGKTTTITERRETKE